MTTTAIPEARIAAPFGSRPRVPRPVLLMIVFGLFLVIVGVTAVAQTVLVSVHASAASKNAILSSDAATVRTFVNGLVTQEDLTGSAPAEQVTLVEDGLRSIARRGEIVRIEIRDPTGVVRLSSDPTSRGATAPDTEAFAIALGGEVDAQLIREGETTEALGTPIAATDLLREYFPLIGPNGKVQGVVAMWRDGAPILDAIEKVRGDVVLVTLSGAFIIALLLFLVFRSAQKRITRQTLQLVEATRLDALTGLPNHGALVGELAVAIEATRRSGHVIAVALVDLDNFRNVNDTYGHEAGDIALRQLATTLGALLPSGSLIGRYGPDEFLVIGTGLDANALEPLIDAVRQGLDAQNLDIEASERLPITISAGIAGYPEHAKSVTALLSTAAMVLAEAKASGGDSLRVAGRNPEATGEQRSFDVLQGLVFAVDTKDRYTKRHSEDVSRYGSFLAQQLGLEASFVEGVAAAGLLHDVGKIGIPDMILRKPGRLTTEEYEIVKQHVALGESIVRNVPHIEIVRAGIRHHHERWDGKGYIEELAGEEIPLVARILAIADAFSAMTTTRPYRKALSVEEALSRLGDAAGSQVDERLVTKFINAIETVPDAPLPGVDRPGPALWVPRTQVA